MINAPEQHIIPVIPSPDQFSRWVEESMARLGKRPSHYLLECEKPGSKNRVSNFMKCPENMRLVMACELQRQILTDAVRQGENLKPIEIKPLSSILGLN